MAGPVQKYDGEFVIENIDDLKNEYRLSDYVTKPTHVPVSKIVPGPSSLRGRVSAYTPSVGGNPLNMDK